MPTNEPVPHYYQEDEIDLKELFKILWLKKNLIIGLTLAITILAGVYAFSKTPTYEDTAEAYFELGHYKDARNQAASLMPINELINEINFFFNSGAGNSISVTSLERKIPTVKITAKGVSSEISSNKVSKVFEFIIEEEQKAIETRKHYFNLKLKENKDKTKKEINTVNEKIVLLDNNIPLMSGRLVRLKYQLSTLEDDFLAADDVLVAYHIKREKREVLSKIESLKIHLFELQYELNKLYSELDHLKNKLKLFESESPFTTYRAAKLIGKIKNSDTTTYPKKKLIVAVAFVAGLMLSIFLALIMNAFREEDEKVAS